MLRILTVSIAIVILSLSIRPSSAQAPQEDKAKQQSVAERLTQADVMLSTDFGREIKICEALDHIAFTAKIRITYNEGAFKTADAQYSFDTAFGVPLLEKGPLPGKEQP